MRKSRSVFAIAAVHGAPVIRAHRPDAIFCGNCTAMWCVFGGERRERGLCIVVIMVHMKIQRMHHMSRARPEGEGLGLLPCGLLYTGCFASQPSLPCSAPATLPTSSCMHAWGQSFLAVCKRYHACTRPEHAEGCVRTRMRHLLTTGTCTADAAAMHSIEKYGAFMRQQVLHS